MMDDAAQALASRKTQDVEEDPLLHGFEEEEAALALQRTASSRSALLLLLRLLAPAKDKERLLLLDTGDITDFMAVTVLDAEMSLQSFVADAGSSTFDVSEAEATLQEEVTALEAIFDSAFTCEEADGEKVLRLHLPELSVPGELSLIILDGVLYPLQPGLPLFTPSDPAALKGVVRVSLHRRLAEQAERLALEGSPACYELSNWLGEELLVLLDMPATRLPTLLMSAKELAERRRRKLVSASHMGAAWSATKKMGVLEAEAAAAGITLGAYMKATNQYPMEDHTDTAGHGYE